MSPENSEVQLTLAARITAKITTTTSLWCLFVGTIVITFCFPVVTSIWGITLIDPISSPDEVRAVIKGMSEQQRLVHAWTTATLDVAYPLVYGTLFAAVALRFFPTYGGYLALLPLAAIPVDLVEGVVQILALTGTADFVDAKAVITPIKSSLFGFGFFVSIAAWIRWAYFRIFSSSKPG